MDHVDISSPTDASIVATLHVRMPQLPTSSSELSQQINANAKNVSRPCLNRVVTCVPTNKWVPDVHATQCMAPDCQQQFTFFNRKHHCRVCGKIFCTNCCSKQLSAPAVYATAITTEETNRQQNSTGHHRHGHTYSSSGTGGGGGGAVAAAPVSPTLKEAVAAVATNSPTTSTAATPTLPTAVVGSPSGKDAQQQQQQQQQVALASAVPQMVTVKVCRECYYDHQLAVCRRDVATAEPRKRHRGELKMIQRARLLQICSFLPLKDLFNFSLVCSDFYFITRDNTIWIWHNATRWPDKRLMGKGAAAGGSGGGAQQYQVAKYRPNSDDDLSYHCSYNFTQFLHYCHLLEATRCEGLSNFANSARQVLSGYVKVAVIGPENIGKTLMIQRFLNGGPACVAPAGGAVNGGAGGSSAVNNPPHMPNCVYPTVPAGAGSTSYRPTAGIAVSQKSVVISGGLSLESSGLTIIDVAGHPRFDKLRTMACRGAHAIIMCYSVHSKKSLIDAAMMTFAMEQELGPQPVIVCGIAGQGPLEVTAQEAAPSSGRGRASIQVTPTAHGGAEAFSSAVQAILERLMDGGRHSQELLGLSTNPSVLDVLLDLKG